jgi:hypothetical protein
MYHFAIGLFKCKTMIGSSGQVFLETFVMVVLLRYDISVYDEGFISFALMDLDRFG